MDDASTDESMVHLLNYRVSQCKSLITSNRKPLLKKLRFANLTNFVKSRKMHNGNLPIPEKMNEYIFKPMKLVSANRLSMYFLSVGYLIRFLMDHPSILAQQINKLSKSRDYLYLIHVTVPAIYGYFSSDEQVSDAMCFYKCVVDLEDPKRAALIMEPIWTSGMTFRFGESVLDGFFWAFATDQTVKKKHKSPRRYAEVLLENVKRFVSLLPKALLDMWKYCSERWSVEDQNNLLINGFLTPLSLLWIQRTPAAPYQTIFFQIVRELSNCQAQLASLREAMSKSLTLLHIPSLYSCIHNKFFNTILSVRDVYLLKNLMNIYKNPVGMTEADQFAKKFLDELDIIPQTRKYEVIYATVYVTNRPVTWKSDHCIRIFPDFSRYSLVEELLDLEIILKGITTWTDLSTSFQEALMELYLSDYVTKKAATDVNNFVASFQGSQKLFKPKPLKKMLFLALLRHNYYFCGRSLHEELNSLEAEWNSIAARLPQIMQLPTINELFKGYSPSLKDNFLIAIQMMLHSSLVPLWSKLYLITGALERLDIIVNAGISPEVLFPLFFAHQKSKTMFSGFVRIYHCAFKNARFQALCTPKEKILWNNFDQMIKFTLEWNPSLVVAFMTFLPKLYLLYPVHHDTNADEEPKVNVIDNVLDSIFI